MGNSLSRPARTFFAVLLLLSAVLGVVLGRVYLFATRPGPPGHSFGTTAERSVTSGEPVKWFPGRLRGAPVELSGRTLQSREISLSRLRGRVTVVNVWASWCAPCRQEAPVLARLSKTYAARGVAFIGVNIRDNPSAASSFARAHDITYPSLQDGAARAVLTLRPYVPANAVPVTLVLDRRGRVAGQVIGILRESSLKAALDDTLAERPDTA